MRPHVAGAVVRAATVVVGSAVGLLLVATCSAATALPSPSVGRHDPTSQSVRPQSHATPPATAVSQRRKTEQPAGTRVSWWTLAVIGLLGAAVGAGVTYAVTRSRTSTTADPSTPATPVPQLSASSPDLEQLIGAVIAARDLAEPASVMAQRLGAALAGVGVSELAPLGQPFDPSSHHAVHITATTDPARSNLIAEVQRVGYCDAQRTIRPPEVVVFRLEPAT